MTRGSPTGAARVADGRGETALVIIQEGGPKPALVCVHGQAGHLRLFESLARHVDPAQPVYGLRGVDRDLSSRAPYRSFEEMANRYVRELGELDHGGPYLILGECNGGELAYALAQALDAGGKDVALLALVDSFAPGEPRLAVGGWAYRYLNSLRMLAFHLSAVLRIDARDRRAYVATRLKRLLTRIRTRASGRGGPPSAELLRERAYGEAAGAYRPTPFDGRVALFRGTSLPWGARTTPDLGWRRLAADVEIIEIPAYYGTCMLEPVVGQLAQAIEHAAAVSTRSK